jgi:hypothetical protein
VSFRGVRSFINGPKMFTLFLFLQNFKSFMYRFQNVNSFGSKKIFCRGLVHILLYGTNEFESSEILKFLHFSCLLTEMPQN